MHISKDLLFSLQEARMALAADSWLVIGECVRPYDNQPIYPELMFQILDSFTNVQTDPEVRPNPGFLTAEQWRRAFLRAGFGHAERSEEHTSELQSPYDLVCRLLLEKKKKIKKKQQ